MIADIGTVIAGLIDGMTTLFTPGTYNSGEGTVGAVAVMTLFAVPVLIGVVRKVTSMVKSTKG